ESLKRLKHPRRPRPHPIPDHAPQSPHLDPRTQSIQTESLQPLVQITERLDVQIRSVVLHPVDLRLKPGISWHRVLYIELEALDSEVNLAFAPPFVSLPLVYPIREPAAERFSNYQAQNFCVVEPGIPKCVQALGMGGHVHHSSSWRKIPSSHDDSPHPVYAICEPSALDR
ncbi:hypothetical protein CVT26_000884, partial [Gymnopilus dilepis]